MCLLPKSIYFESRSNGMRRGRENTEPKMSPYVLFCLYFCAPRSAVRAKPKKYKRVSEVPTSSESVTSSISTRRARKRFPRLSLIARKTTMKARRRIENDTPTTLCRCGGSYRACRCLSSVSPLPRYVIWMASRGVVLEGQVVYYSIRVFHCKIH